MSGEQRWHPAYLPQPLYAALLALAFEWGIAAYDLRLEEYLEGEHPHQSCRSGQWLQLRERSGC